MGKKENIKKAKKLKDAKRKREQNDLIAAGLGPAGIVLKQRSILNGDKTISNQSKIRYSELFKAFVLPMLTATDTIETIKMKFTFATYAWNAATERELSETAYLLTKKDILEITQNSPEVEQLFNEMVRRKQKDFLAYKNIIADFEIKKIRGLDFDLTVATIPVKDIIKV